MTNTGWTFAPVTGYQNLKGQAINQDAALAGAWQLAVHCGEDVIVRQGSRDIVRVSAPEWMDEIEVEEPAKVRHTSCEHCGLDVEVWLDATVLEGSDRGGERHCRDGRLHEPILDADDLDAREYWVGE